MNHPILGRRGRIAPYLAAWSLFGVLLTAVLVGARAMRPGAALLVAVPLAVVYGFFCLAAWYPCRATPLGAAGSARLLGTHAAGALLCAGLWVALAEGWVAALSASGRVAVATSLEGGRLFLFALGVVLYLLAVAVHYLVIAFEESRRAEVQTVELQVLAREAELKALRAQINPHFLFNSLNSVSALIGSDNQAARRMAVLLADFFRQSLRLGGRAAIPLADELALVANYLAIERVRFGPRLQVSEAVSDAARACLVPPLLLQPLVENAVVHGIAELVEGGAVRSEASVEGGILRIAFENPCDPDRPRSRGAGVGLANVRARLERRYGSRGVLRIQEAPERFRVEVELPAEPAAPSGERPLVPGEKGP
jgi:histidine kinase